MEKARIREICAFREGRLCACNRNGPARPRERDCVTVRPVRETHKFSDDTSASPCGSLKLNMQRMEDRWRRRLEIEAKECEHADRIASRSLPFVPSEHGSAKQSPSVRVAEANQQPACHESSQSVKPPPSPPNRTKPGRRRRLADSFVVCAGELWRKAIGESKTKVSNGQLREIASVLDAAKYLPPAVYLEVKFARELKAFNSQHSKSKEAGPILTWSQLVAHADKDHLQGMRRLLSR
jgi:hypothetical protein